MNREWSKWKIRLSCCVTVAAAFSCDPALYLCPECGLHRMVSLRALVRPRRQGAGGQLCQWSDVVALHLPKAAMVWLKLFFFFFETLIYRDIMLIYRDIILLTIYLLLFNRTITSPYFEYVSHSLVFWSISNILKHHFKRFHLIGCIGS